jgi:hypothetical protein
MHMVRSSAKVLEMPCIGRSMHYEAGFWVRMGHWFWPDLYALWDFLAGMHCYIMHCEIVNCTYITVSVSCLVRNSAQYIFLCLKRNWTRDIQWPSVGEIQIGLLELGVAATFLLQCGEKWLIEGQLELCHSWYIFGIANLYRIYTIAHLIQVFIFFSCIPSLICAFVSYSTLTLSLTWNGWLSPSLALRSVIF